MKRVIALLLGLVLIACTFTACFSMAPEETHTHTYSETWSSDAEGHWYDPTCDCEDAPIKKLAHADANNDGACDVCTFTNHTHTYAEGWTVDCTNHWHAADCGHTVAGTDVAAHVDENEDGKCDVCAYVIEDIHVHYYDDAWSNDAEYHWHAALCEHSVEVADKEAHILDAAGYCTICDAKINEIDKTNIEAVLKAAVARNNKVTGGKVIYQNDIYDLVDGEYVSSAKNYNNVYYTLGNGYSYINWITVTDYGNYANQQWYELLNAETGEIFGVQSTDGGLTFSEVTGAPEHLNGYNYMPSTLLAGVEVTTSTLADTLLAIYTLSTADTAGNVDIEYDEETGVYAIAYDYVALNVLDFTDPDTGDKTTTYETSYFVVAAAFECNEDGVITEAAIIVDSYQDAEYDDDYDYNERTGVVTMNDNAAPNRYAYVVAQTSGERTYTTAYPKASLVPTSFDLTYNNEVIGDTLTIDAGVYTTLYLANFTPLTSDASFIGAEDVTIEVVNNDTNSTYTFSPYFSTYSGYIGFNAQQAGTFTLTVTYKEMVKTITITVNAPVPQSIGAYAVTEESGWGDTWLEVSENNPISNVNLDPGETLDFAVRVSPALADQGFTYTVDSDLATVREITLNDVIVFTENLETYTALQFVSDTEGTYTVTFTSTKDANVTGTLVVNVGNVGGGEDISGSGTNSDPYVITDGDYTCAFPGGYDYVFYTYTATEAGSLTVTVTSSDFYWGMGSGPYLLENYANMFSTYTINVAAGETVWIGMSTYSGNADNVTFTVAFTASAGGDEDVSGTGSGTDSDPYVITDGNYTCAFPGGYNYVFYTYTATEAGSLTVTVTSSDFYWGMGSGPYLLENYANMFSTYTINVAAGETVWIGMSTYSGNADDITFTVAFTASASGDEDVSGTGSGTDSDPYVITDGDYTCAFPGGYNYVFYTYTATEAGSLTVTVTSSDFYWAAGSGAYALENYGTMFTTKTFELAAGETLWIGMSTNSCDAADVTFTVAFTTSAGGDEGGENDTGSTSYKDANGLGGEYTFNFVMDYTLTFSATSEGATTGTLTVVDAIYPQYSGTYSYEIVEGAYVFDDDTGIVVTNDGTSWTFQNAGMGVAKAFAQV